MAVVGTSAYANLLKTRYTRKKIMDLTVRRCPTMAQIDKDTGFGGGGDGYVNPVILDTNQGISGTFYAAKQNRSPGSDKKFNVTRRTLYGVFAVSGEVIRASQRNDLAFMAAKTRQMDSTWKGFGREMGIHFFRDGTGRRGRLASTVDVSSAAALELEDHADAKFLSVDMAISLTAAGATYRNATTDSEGNARGAVAYIKAVDEDAGTFTVAATRGGAAVAINTLIAAAAVSDYIVRDGDLNTVPHGLAGWIPATAPTPGDSWFGVDRSTDPRKLAGLRHGSTPSPVAFTQANVIKFINKLYAVEADTDLVVCSPDNWAALEIELGAKKTYVDKVTLGARGYRSKETGEAEVIAGIGFEALKIHGPNGDVAIIQDTFCPNNRAYGLDTDTWEFSSNQEMPQILAEDNGELLLREANSESYEGRIGGEGNLVCNAPGLNGVMVLP